MCKNKAALSGEKIPGTLQLTDLQETSVLPLRAVFPLTYPKY